MLENTDQIVTGGQHTHSHCADHQLVRNGTAHLMPADCTPACHPFRSLLKCSLEAASAAEIVGKISGIRAPGSD